MIDEAKQKRIVEGETKNNNIPNKMFFTWKKEAEEMSIFDWRLTDGLK